MSPSSTPDDANYTRAANQPRPADFVEAPPSHLTPKVAKALAAVGSLVFFPDHSSYQPYYDSSMPYVIDSFRVSSGYSVDPKAVGNWRAILADLNTGKLKMVFAYIVFIPGKLAAVQGHLTSIFGATPDSRVVFMVDMESGAGFAGPGNHSAEANQWVTWFRAYAGDARKAYGYANGSDWANSWPTVPGGMLKHTARYSISDPQPYGWQYAGGNASYPAPTGYPRSCPPFGSYIDMNVINRPIAQILADFGITEPAPTVTRKVDVMYEVWQDTSPGGATYYVEFEGQTGPRIQRIGSPTAVGYLCSNVSCGQYNAANPSAGAPRALDNGNFTPMVDAMNGIRAGFGGAPIVKDASGFWTTPPDPAPLGGGFTLPEIAAGLNVFTESTSTLGVKP